MARTREIKPTGDTATLRSTTVCFAQRGWSRSLFSKSVCCIHSILTGRLPGRRSILPPNVSHGPAGSRELRAPRWNMPFRSRSNRRGHALGLASRSLFLPRAMGMGDIPYTKLGELRRQIAPAECATSPKASHLTYAS